MSEWLEDILSGKDDDRKIKVVMKYMELWDVKPAKTQGMVKIGSCPIEFPEAAVATMLCMTEHHEHGTLVQNLAHYFLVDLSEYCRVVKAWVDTKKKLYKKRHAEVVAEIEQAIKDNPHMWKRCSKELLEKLGIKPEDVKE